MKINISLYFSLQEDYKKYQSMQAAEEMYRVAAEAVHFEIVRSKGFNLHGHTPI
jgi:GH35 family endo-1,4-beta-xylanase